MTVPLYLMILKFIKQDDPILKTFVINTFENYDNKSSSKG